MSASEYGFVREAEKFRGQDMIHGPEIASDLRPVVYSSRNNPKQVAPLL